MIKVKSFYTYNDSILKDFDEKIEQYLSEQNIAKDDIIAVIPIYTQNLLGNTFTSGITFIYSK